MQRAIGIICLLFGATILSVCFYYDRERYKNANLKKRLREKRTKLRKEQIPYYEISPATIDPQFREAMIINEIQVAEKLMLCEKWEEAIVHFAHAISVCADPGHLLNCLRETLPTQSYDMLLQILSSMYDERNSLDNHSRKPMIVRVN